MNSRQLKILKRAYDYAIAETYLNGMERDEFEISILLSLRESDLQGYLDGDYDTWLKDIAVEYEDAMDHYQLYEEGYLEL